MTVMYVSGTLALINYKDNYIKERAMQITLAYAHLEI
jgi:hypothetical protein